MWSHCLIAASFLRLTPATASDSALSTASGTAGHQVQHLNGMTVPSILQSRHKPGYCIQAEKGAVSGSEMKLESCGKVITQFGWDTATHQIKLTSNPGLCVSASTAIFDATARPAPLVGNSTLHLRPCVDGVMAQKFLIGRRQIRNQARQDLCIGADQSVELGYCNAHDGQQTFDYISDEDAQTSLLGWHPHHHESMHQKSSVRVGSAGKTHAENVRPHDGLARKSALVEQKEDSYRAMMRRGESDEETRSKGLYERTPLFHTTEGSSVQESAPNTHITSHVDALMDRIGHGLVEDHDDDEIDGDDIDSMLERAVLSKRRPPPPPPPPPKVDCAFGRWSKWAPCTAKCGGGKQDRSRGEKTPSEHGGKPCDGEYEEERDCNAEPCAPPPPPPTTPAPATTPMMAKGGASLTVLATSTAVCTLLARMF